MGEALATKPGGQSPVLGSYDGIRELALASYPLISIRMLWQALAHIYAHR